MEALTAVSVALLTIYDMCKAVDGGMTITGVRLLEKHGGEVGALRGGGMTSGSADVYRVRPEICFFPTHPVACNESARRPK